MRDESSAQVLNGLWRVADGLRESRRADQTASALRSFANARRLSRPKLDASRSQRRGLHPEIELLEQSCIVRSQFERALQGSDGRAWVPGPLQVCDRAKLVGLCAGIVNLPETQAPYAQSVVHPARHLVERDQTVGRQPPDHGTDRSARDCAL